jgi:hypothetical protein
MTSNISEIRKRFEGERGGGRESRGGEGNKEFPQSHTHVDDITHSI